MKNKPFDPYKTANKGRFNPMQKGVIVFAVGLGLVGFFVALVIIDSFG